MEHYGWSKEMVTAKMMLNKNMKSMVRSPDGDINFFNIFSMGYISALYV